MSRNNRNVKEHEHDYFHVSKNKLKGLLAFLGVPLPGSICLLLIKGNEVAVQILRAVGILFLGLLSIVLIGYSLAKLDGSWEGY